MACKPGSSRRARACTGFNHCALAERHLRPGVGRLGDAEQKNRDVIAAAELLVEVAARWLVVQNADQTCFFPDLLQGDLAGGGARLDAALGNDPAFAAAGGDEADLAVAHRNGPSLPNAADGCH